MDATSNYRHRQKSGLDFADLYALRYVESNVGDAVSHSQCPDGVLKMAQGGKIQLKFVYKSFTLDTSEVLSAQNTKQTIAGRDGWQEEAKVDWQKTYSI